MKSDWSIKNSLTTHTPIKTLGMIWAQDQNGLIGLNNQMPWHISEDFKHFKETTLNCPIIMGRSNFEAMGRPLPHRQNIILSNNESFRLKYRDNENITIVSTLEEAFSQVDDPELVWIIGGAKLYESALPYADLLVVSVLDKTIDVPSDAHAVYAPIIETALWQKDSARSDTDFRPVAGDTSFRVDVYMRR